ncbi:hypothetical protein JCM8097_007224 [Rhodosporidiobolus ruineniae]
MTSLRPPSTPRASLLPTSTPSRRKSAIARPPSAQAYAANELSSLRQAISANDPAAYDSADAAVGLALGDGHSQEGSSGSERRQPILPGAAAASRTGSAAGMNRHPARPPTPKTPTTRSRTPTGFGSSTNRFSGPRPAEEAQQPGKLRVGSEVMFEVAGERMEGTLRFVGEIEGKAGTWGGVELDEQFAGQGKNDGSVAGTQYFACPPACGLFLAMSKIIAKPKAAPPLSSTSRASMTAKDLAARRLSSAVAGSATPTAKKAATPRRSLSPSKPRTSLSPTKRLSVAPSSSMATPKPSTRLARPSIGGSAFSTPTTARKSLGGFGATPRASNAASIKRPASSLRQHTSAPEVPPIPSAYGLARSVTPSSASGRVTPSTPGAMLKTLPRRTSLAQSEASSSARPTTPSFRSQSRQSFASSISRQSHRSTASTSTQQHLDDDLRGDLEDARQQEAELRALLDASEKDGREKEDRLDERERQLRAAEERVRQLEAEQVRAREEEKRRLEGVEGEAGDLERERLRARELEARLAESEKALTAQSAAVERLKLEERHKSAAKEAEVESLRERLEQKEKDFEAERVELLDQVDKLRTAGAQLCETYEEKIAEIELARLEAEEKVEELHARLDGQAALPRSGSSASLTRNGAGSPSRAAALSSSHASSAASAIDAETLQIDYDHLVRKVAGLEEQLHDARVALQESVDEAAEKRRRREEVEGLLKEEVKKAREALARSKDTESRSADRIRELQDALTDLQSTLEAERVELEGLRDSASGDASAPLVDELKRVRAELDKAQREASTAAELRDDLRIAEKEIERLQRLSLSVPTSPDANGHGGRRSSAASLLGAKDEATATRDTIVGLKTIIQTLTEENEGLLKENKELQGRVEELSDSAKALEATVENLMTQLDSPSAPSSPSAERSASAASQKKLVQLESELKDVKSKLEKETAALNQEIEDLTAVLEERIAREGELEYEISRLKSASSSSAKKANGLPHNHDHERGFTTDDDASSAGGECEMCGKTGHDLDSCPDFASGSPTTSIAATAPPRASTDANGAADYCDDCDEYGHSLDDCPLADQVF